MGFGVGDLLAGKYRVERIIGRGGMGVVLGARHVDLGELFAVKLVDGVDRSGGERLLREARASARLRGEHIVRLHDVGWLAERTPFLVLELVRGESVSAELRARGRFSAEDTALVVLHTCLALAEAHANGLVHRDVKASNLLATQRPDGSRIIKLLDFGIAKLSERDGDHRITGDSATLGSPASMSPEQIRDAHTVDARTDVWALGVLAQELFTGKLPFAASTTGGVLASIVADEPAALPDDTPAALRAAIRGCLVKEVDERLPTVADVADALAPLLAEGALLAGRVRATLIASPRPRDQPEPRGRPSLAATTRDEPTYDPTELSADEASSRASSAAGARDADERRAASDHRAVERRAGLTKRLASPWIIPAVALPLAASLALFASSRRPANEPRSPVVAAPSTLPAPVASDAAPVEGAGRERDEAPPGAASAGPVAGAAGNGAAASSASIAPRRNASSPGTARSARPTPTVPASPAAPPPDDLDRFGGRK